MTVLLCIIVSVMLFIVSFVQMSMFTIPDKLVGMVLGMSATMFFCTGLLLIGFEEILRKNKAKQMAIKNAVDSKKKTNLTEKSDSKK